jgi:hypothetical protein
MIYILKLREQNILHLHLTLLENLPIIGDFPLYDLKFFWAVDINVLFFAFVHFSTDKCIVALVVWFFCVSDIYHIMSTSLV